MLISSSLTKKKIDVKRLIKKELGTQFISKVIKKTGPKNVYHIFNDESSLTLGLNAVNKLFKNFNYIKKKDIKNIISVTETPKLKFPGNSFDYASNVGLDSSTFCLDINSGCTGFVDALKIAFSMKGKSLIVCSETYSKHQKIFNRSVTPIFSDAAAAILFDKKNWKLIDFNFQYEKNTSKLISCANDQDMQMSGKDVVNFVSDKVVKYLNNVISKYNPEHIFLHQGSSFVLDYIKSKLNKRIFIHSNIKHIGNTVSASIPILFEKYLKTTKIKDKEKILFLGFGVGVALSGILLEKKKCK